MTIQDINIEDTKNNLSAAKAAFDFDTYAKTIIGLFDDAGLKKNVKPAERLQAQYEIAQLLNEARAAHPSNEKFGDWQAKNIIQNGERRVTKRTLQRWRDMPEFGTLAECMLIGATNVTTLAKEGFEDVRSEIREILKKGVDGDNAKKLSKSLRQKIKDRIDKIRVEKIAGDPDHPDNLKARIKKLESQQGI